MVKFANNNCMNNFITYENVQYMSLPSQVNYSSFIVSNAQTNDYDFVQIVVGVGKVRQAVCYKMANGEVLVGVLSEPLFSLSERLNLLLDIEKAVKEITHKNVYVTLDTDLFVGISKCKEDAKAEQLKELIIMRNSARM